MSITFLTQIINSRIDVYNGNSEVYLSLKKQTETLSFMLGLLITFAIG